MEDDPLITLTDDEAFADRVMTDEHWIDDDDMHFVITAVVRATQMPGGTLWSVHGYEEGNDACLLTYDELAAKRCNSTGTFRADATRGRVAEGANHTQRGNVGARRAGDKPRTIRKPGTARRPCRGRAGRHETRPSAANRY